MIENNTKKRPSRERHAVQLERDEKKQFVR